MASLQQFPSGNFHVSFHFGGRRFKRSLKTKDQRKALAAKELWASVFLNRREIEELLDFVRDTTAHAFIYPMFVFAAHTGARRSELMRSQIADIGEQMLTIRERKKKKRKQSTRQVPVSTRLRAALNEWFDLKPNCCFTICHTYERGCHSAAGDPISQSEANSHFRHSLLRSRFKHLRGWHVSVIPFAATVQRKGLINGSSIPGSDILPKKCVNDIDTCSQTPK